MELWELAAREAIRQLVASYALHADGGRFAELAHLFVPDGVLALPDGRNATGRTAIVELLASTKSDLVTTTATPLIRHYTSNLLVTVQDQATAAGICYFFVITERGPDHWGRYKDTYACVDGTWLFRQRQVRLDGFAPGSWASARRG